MASVPLDIPDGLIDALADAVAARVVEQLRENVASDDDRWLTTREAADYLGLSVNALHKLTSAREGPEFSQDGAGAKCWFRRSALDAWRETNLRGQRC